MKPKILDLFCGVGGAGEGYLRAGFDVTGVDIISQPNNPHKFRKADALNFLKKHWDKFDVVHASPPCQQYSVSTKQFRNKGKEYPQLIEPIRDFCLSVGIPYIIENVPQAPIRKDVILRAYMFGLPMKRERVFELGGGLFMLQEPVYKTKKQVKNGDFVTVCGAGSLKGKKGHPIFKDHKGSILENWRFAQGIDWALTYKELANAIPPAYTKYIGDAIFEQVLRLKK